MRLGTSVLSLRRRVGLFIRRALVLRPWGLIAVSALAVASSAMGAFDGMLAQLHATGQASGRVVDLWFDPTSPEGPRHDRSVEIICGWQAVDVLAGSGMTSSACLETDVGALAASVQPATTPPLEACSRDDVTNCKTSDGRHLAQLHLLFDMFLFAPAYTFLIIAIWRRLRLQRRLPGEPSPDIGPWAAAIRFRTSWFVAGAAVVAFVADEIENILTLGLVTRTWSDESALLPSSLSDQVVVSAIWGAGLLKWLAVVGALLPLAFTAVGWLIRFRKVAFRLVPVVAIVAAPFVVLQNAQAADAVRRWGWQQWAVTVAVTILLAAAGAALACKIAGGLRQAEILNLKGRLWRGVVMIILGVALGVVGWLWARHSPWVPGVGALALVIGVAYCLSGPLEISANQSGDDEAGPHVSRFEAAVDRLPNPVIGGAIIAGVPVLAIFTPALEAVVGEAFYFLFDGFWEWIRSPFGVAFLRTVAVLAVGPLLAVEGVHRIASRASSRASDAEVSEPTAISSGKDDDRRELAAEAGGIRLRSWLLLALLVAVVVWVLVARSQWFQQEVAANLGAVAMLISFLTVLVLALWLASFVADALIALQRNSSTEVGPWTFPSAVRILGLRRPPVVTGVLLWALVAPIADAGTYHSARREPPTASSGYTLDEYVMEWHARQDTPVGARTPIAFVAGSGGGIRAAYWTAAVLDCLVNRNSGGPGKPCAEPAAEGERQARLSRLFALSGISGSSLGLVTFVAGAIDSPTSEAGEPAVRLKDDAATAGGADPSQQATTEVWEEAGWYKELLDDDFLTPTLSRWLYNDTLNVWLRQSGDCTVTDSTCGGDRAAALEQAWERAWDGTTADSPLEHGFVEWQTRSDRAHPPVLLLNSYSAEDGCRFNVSALVSNGARGPEQCRVFRKDLGNSDESPIVLDATTDLLDFDDCRPDEPAVSDSAAEDEPATQIDLPISTATLLSARFPFVTPSGKVEGCDGSASYLVDGGYRDTSAASTLVELWPRIDEQLQLLSDSQQQLDDVRSIFIQIDNGYHDATAPQPDSRPNELLVPSNSRAEAMGGVANASKQAAERVFDCFIRITTLAHPGSQAPLGWVLSESSQTSLDNQLIANAAEIETARTLLDDPAASTTSCPLDQ